VNPASSSTPDPLRRILSLGHNQGIFLVPLYRGIADHLPGVQFDVLDFFTFGPGMDLGEAGVFRRFLRTEPLRFNFDLARGVARASRSGLFWKRPWWRLVSGGGTLRELAREFATAIRAANFGTEQRPPGGYDLYHFHLCISECLKWIDGVPPSARILCSFWGSDLMRAYGRYEYLHQSRALERADAITLHSPEMREILLSKFGRHLQPKVHLARYSLYEKSYELIDQIRQQPGPAVALRQELRIPDNRWLVVVGHNGNPSNNHLEIIAALAGMPAAEKAPAIWVFPMSYTASEDHTRAVEFAARSAGLDFRIFTRYLAWPELAAFRCATDLLIHLPISDALSGTVLEVLYAGRPVLTGGWLPYSLYRRAQLPLLTVDDFSELPGMLAGIWQRRDALRAEAEASRPRIREHFFPDATVPTWIRLFQTLLAPRSSAD
jgi:glycosyltransferase involved in cell wall biosynthesis